MAQAEARTNGILGALKRWTDSETLSHHQDKILLVLTLIIGAAVGMVVVAFIVLTENLGARMYPPGGAAWRRLTIPVAGALFSGYLLWRYFPDARGSGIPQTKTAVFLRGGVIAFRTAVGKFACCAVSLASGIALGREGPAVQVGAGMASSLGRRLGLSPDRVKSLAPIGAAAALAAAFNTPIAAVLFTLEEVMGDMHAPVLGSIVLSSATSWMVLHMLLGDEPLFHVPAYQLVHPLEFGVYAVLGLAGGLVSVAFVKLLLWLRKQFMRMPARTLPYQPVAGALVVGILGWFVPEVLGVGYGFVSKALNGQMVLGMMAMLVLLKLVATASCYASGNAGGIFGPSLFLGAMLGGALGAGAHALLPDYTGSVGAYALVGMGTAFAGIVRVPLTSVIMIFEVTRDYSIIVPLMISNLIAYLVSSRLQAEPIYEALLDQDGIHLPPGAGNREEMLPVSQALRPAEETLPGNETVERAVSLASSGVEAWPVMESGRFLGMVTRDRLFDAMHAGWGGATLAALLAVERSQEQKEEEDGAPRLYADESLDTALRRLARSGMSVLPVVNRADREQLMGVVSLRDVMAAYGLENGGTRAEAPAPAKPASTGLLGGVAAVVVVAAALTGILGYAYHTQRVTRAQRFFKEGNELMQADRYEEAVERYRSALSISHASQQRLALAMALVKAGHLGEAEIYLRELVSQNPKSGPANLGLGRALMEEGNTERAVAYYHRAIDGAWPKDAQANRAEARLELVNALGKAGAKAQARAELMALAASKPADAAIRRRVASLLAEYGLPRESAAAFRDILRTNPGDAASRAGVGEADLAMGDLQGAQAAFREAARLDRSNAAYRSRLEMVEETIALDPTMPHLRAAERYQRSLKLLEAAVGAMDQCAAGKTAALPPAARSAVDAGRKTLLRRERPFSYSDSADTNVRLAQKIWGARIAQCGAAGPGQEALSRAMALAPSQEVSR